VGAYIVLQFRPGILIRIPHVYFYIISQLILPSLALVAFVLSYNVLLLLGTRTGSKTQRETSMHVRSTAKHTIGPTRFLQQLCIILSFPTTKQENNLTYQYSTRS